MSAEIPKPEPGSIQPETTDLDRKAQALGDGVEKDQLHPPLEQDNIIQQPDRLCLGDNQRITYLTGQHAEQKPSLTCPTGTSREERIAELLKLCHTEIHLPNVYKFLTDEQETELTIWANSLTDSDIGDQIATRHKKIDEDLEGQFPSGKWPPSITKP